VYSKDTLAIVLMFPPRRGERAEEKKTPRSTRRPPHHVDMYVDLRTGNVVSRLVSCRGVAKQGIEGRGGSTYFPASHTEEESEDIRLLLLLKLFDVFEGTHLDCGSVDARVSSE
jgi:hypothetical protein